MAETLDVPVLGWPFRVGGYNQSEIAFVEQDSPAEVAECVAMTFSVERGSLVDAPKLGLVDPSFRTGGVSLATLLSVAQRWEPRAILTFTHDQIIALAQTVGITVSA
jgi:hypothetical protein